MSGQALGRWTRRLLDDVMALALSVTAAVLLPIYGAWVVLASGIDRAIARARGAGRGRALLVLSEASSFDELQAAGLLPLFEEWLLDGYFAHLYLVVFHAPATRWHRVNDRLTVIDIGKRGRWLKQWKCAATYTLLNALLLVHGVLGLRGLVRREIAVIRGCNPHHMGALAILLGAVTGTPTCVSIHSDNEAYYRLWKRSGQWPDSHAELFGRRWVSRLVMRWVYSMAPEIWVIRDVFRQEAVAYGARPNRIRLFPHSSRLERFHATPDDELRQQFGLGNRPLVVSVCRLTQENYIDDLPDIAALVLRARPDALLVIVGGGAEELRLRSRVAAAGLEDSVRLLGWQPNDVAIELRQLAAVNLCLRGGYSLIEAAAAGRPVVAYNTDWHYELVRDEVSGYLVAEGDVEAAARRIVQLLDDPHLAGQLGANARALALARHDHAAVTPQKRELYDHLVGAA